MNERGKASIRWLFPLLAGAVGLLLVTCVPGNKQSQSQPPVQSTSERGPGLPSAAEYTRDSSKAGDKTPYGGSSTSPEPAPVEKQRAEPVPSSPAVPRRSTTVTAGERVSPSEVETLPGFKASVEYVAVPSVHYPNAVVAVMLPLDYKDQPSKRYPLVLAFGGAGECAKPPRQGALAWVRYYKTDEAAAALGNGVLGRRDFRGLVTNAQLTDFNGRLHDSPYEGVILACPSSPLLSAQERLEFPQYEAFVMKDLLPELRKRYRVTPGKVGVDGVSMGGARSMYYGFKYPDVFLSIGSVQGAFGPYFEVYRELLKRNKEMIKGRAVQLVTSDGDVMLRAVERMRSLLQAEGIPHEYLRLTGPHDYIFNQGPGALALLLFHSQALGSASLGPIK